MWRTEHY